MVSVTLSTVTMKSMGWIPKQPMHFSKANFYWKKWARFVSGFSKHKISSLRNCQTDGTPVDCQDDMDSLAYLKGTHALEWCQLTANSRTHKTQLELLLRSSFSPTTSVSVLVSPMSERNSFEANVIILASWHYNFSWICFNCVTYLFE